MSEGTDAAVTRGARGLAAVTAVAADHGLQLRGPVVLRSLTTVLVRLEPHPVMARALVSGTGAIRPGALGRAIREARLLSHLHAVGCPAVPPSPLLPPGPHVRAGVPVVVSQRVPHGLGPRLGSAGGALDGASLARSLREVQAGLATYPGPLPALPHLAETNGWLLRAEVQASLSARTRARMAAAVSEAMAWIVASGVRLQPVHGDAHSGNALFDPAGPLRWSDFEDAALGPAEWDLACLITAARVFGGDMVMADAAIAAWGDYDEQTLTLLVDARAVQVAVWGLIAAAIEPRRARTAERRAAQALAHLERL